MVKISLRDITVKEAMTRRVITIHPDATVDRAAKKMTRARVGTLIVMKNGKPVGILTDSDILRKVVAKNLKPSEVRVKDIMSSPIITVSPSDTLEEAKNKMMIYKVRRLPVVEGGELRGIITATDIMRIHPEVVMLMRSEKPTVAGEPAFGMCERCYNYSEDLRYVNGRWLCLQCREELGYK